VEGVAGTGMDGDVQEGMDCGMRYGVKWGDWVSQ
jgi:hypothetical protein